MLTDSWLGRTDSWLWNTSLELPFMRPLNLKVDGVVFSFFCHNTKIPSLLLATLLFSFFQIQRSNFQFSLYIKSYKIRTCFSYGHSSVSVMGF